MHDILEFMGRHWIVVSLAILAFIWVIIEEAQRQVGGSAGLSPQQVVDKINHEDAVVIDIRENSAFAAGHITGAVNFSKSQIDRDIKLLEKYKAKPLIVVCAMGRSAAVVLNDLRKNGFDHVYLLKGGMTAWENASLPTVKGDK